MLKDFILTVALICPQENSVQVTEVLDTKPMSFMECDKRMLDKEMKQKFEMEKDGCLQDLLCIRVYWKDAKED